MAFFKFRQSGDSSPPPNRPTESIEVMRQRAKHRLIGSVVLVLAGVVGFPLLFDTQPRPMPVDVQIDMPDKNKVAPLPMPPSAVTMPITVAPAVVAASSPGNKRTASPSATDSAKVTAASSLDAKEQLVAPDVPKNKPKVPANTTVDAIQNEAEDASSPVAMPKALPKTKVESKVELKGDKKTDEGARARALLDGKEPSAKVHDDTGRYIIQVGAFAEAAKAQDVRMKLERAGLKTYTHVAETKDGPRTRVRLGPFTNKAESDKAAAKVKALGLPAAMLTL